MTALSTMPARRRPALGTSTPPSAQDLPKTPVSVLGPRSRDATDDCFDGLESPSKKQKRVAFDMDLNMAIDIGSKSLEQTRREVRKALLDLAQGDSSGYDELKEVFGNDTKRYSMPIIGEEEDSLRPEELLVYIVAITNCAPLLGKSSSGLIKSILKCAWLGRDDIFVSAYIQFLAALSSARGPCLGQALSMLVDKFKLARSADWTVPGFPVVSLSLARNRVHLGLQYLLNVFPVARSILCNLLVSKYPYQDEPKSAHAAYIDNLLCLQQYAPDLERDIMELLTRQMVNLDVSMQLDLDNTDDEVTQVVLQQLEPRQNQEGADEEEEDDDSDLDSIHSDDSDLDEIELQIISTKRNIRKLDFIINIIFEFYAPRFSDPDSVEAMAAFTQLCSDFINIVLPTSKTRHSQFLLFHFAQKSPQLTDAFLGTLLAISEDTTRPLIVRRAAIAYIASFVARGARLSPFLTQQVVQTLWRRMDSYRIVHEPACHGPDLQRYSLYYELAQGLMFVFCYRWRDLVVSAPSSVDPDVPASFIDKDLNWIDDLQGAVRRNVRSRLNPLKVCSFTIVEQFAKMSHHLRLDYIYPILAANKAIHLSQVMPAAYHNGGALRESGYDTGEEKWTHIEANAQFDPYQLPDSKHWIDGDYISWQNIPGLNDDDDDDDDDEQEHDGQNGHYESDSDAGEEEELEEDEELEEGTATEDDE